MAETVVDEKAIIKQDQWRELIAAHERSGLSVRNFCKELGIAEHLLFYGRKRLRNQEHPVRFALVEGGAAANLAELAAPIGIRGIDVAPG